MILTLFSFATIVSYTIVAIIICGIPPSLSHTYYLLKSKGVKVPWIFQIALFTTSALLLPAWLEASPEEYQFLVFLSCTGLIFVSAAPLFKLKLEGRVHNAAALICGASSIAWQILSGYWVVTIICIAIALSLAWKYQNTIFWLEMVGCFLSTYITLTLI